MLQNQCTLWQLVLYSRVQTHLPQTILWTVLPACSRDSSKGKECHWTPPPQKLYSHVKKCRLAIEGCLIEEVRWGFWGFRPIRMVVSGRLKILTISGISLAGWKFPLPGGQVQTVGSYPMFHNAVWSGMFWRNVCQTAGPFVSEAHNCSDAEFWDILTFWYFAGNNICGKDLAGRTTFRSAARPFSYKILLHN